MKSASERVGALDWPAVTQQLDALGCASTGMLLRPVECAELRALYREEARFRSTVDMARHRFGEGEYRYFAHPLPELVAELRAAFYPQLLPIARAWAERLGRPAPWPDDFEDWLAQCHDAGQKRPTPLLLATSRAAGTRSTATCTASSFSRCRS